MKKVMLLLVCALVVLAFTVAEAGEGHKKSGAKGATPEEKFAKLDADGNGTLSKAEFPWGDEKFDKFDTDGDGKLTLEEFKTGKAALHKKGDKKDDSCK